MTESRSNRGTPNSFEAATAISRALAAPLRHELRDDAGLALARGVQGLEHGRFLDDPVLHEPLRQAAEARARAAERQRSVVIHGLVATEMRPG